MILDGAGEVVGQQDVAQYVNVGEYFKRRATSLGIKTIGLVKTEEQIQQEAQQAQQMQLAQAAAPQGVKAIADGIKAQQENQVSEE